MPSLQFGLSSYQRARGDLPSLPVINMLAEKSEVEEKGVVLQSRPGLGERGQMGAGPVQALFKRDLVLGSSLYGISGGKLYRSASVVGDVAGSGPYSMAGYENTLFITGGGPLYGYNGTTLAQVAFPDGASVLKVIVAASRLVAIRADTGQFYWSKVLANTIDALDFATAENQPDRLLDVLFIDDQLLLFGSETVEFWSNSQGTIPFTPLTGRVIEKGIRATGAATSLANTFAWVTNENQVCIGDENSIISNPGLQARIEASVGVSLFTFLIEGTEYLCLRLDKETQIYNPRSGTWSEFKSFGQTNWLPQCWAGGVFGSSVDGRTLAWSDSHQDLAGIMERRFRAGFPLNGGGFRVNNIRLRCNTGGTPFLEGYLAEPKVEMRISDDEAHTFGEWEAESLGRKGDYRAQPEWRALGMASQPGFVAEFRVTDSVDWRVSDVLINEAGGGR
jgi:hypothetical protein